MELKFRRHEDYQALRAEMTPHEIYIRRRELLAAAGFAGSAAMLGGLPAFAQTPSAQIAAGAAMAAKKSAYTIADQQAAEQDFNEFCNFYEFGLDKNEPAENAGSLKVTPWSVVVDGEVDSPRTFGIEDLMADPANAALFGELA